MSRKSKFSLSDMVESEINKIQEDLAGVNESLRRLSGSFPSAASFRNESRDPDEARTKEGPPIKRMPASGGVFARLGGVADGGSERRSQFNGAAPRLRRRSLMDPEDTGPPEGPRMRRESTRSDGKGARSVVRHERQASRQYPSDDEMLPDDHEEEFHGKNSLPKPAVASSITRTVGSQSRMEAATLTSDRASRDRNRRMFGALLGTLQSFRKDEAKQRDKEEQRMAVEKKLEKKGQDEEERMKREKRRLVEERRLKLHRMQQLADHAHRVKEHETWADYQMLLTNYIRTIASPPIFWLPKTSSRATNDLMETTAHGIREEVSSRREQLEDELQELIEGLSTKHEHHGNDELPHSDEEGELEYRDGEAGRAMLRRGKGKDEGGGSVDRSVDARDMLLDNRRLKANGDTVSRKRLRSESDVMCGRMVVQVGSGDRVVEVLDHNERPTVAERHKKDRGVSNQVKGLKIKVERETGPSEKESRKITIESSEKDPEKSKKRKAKDSFSNDIEDEVSMMRRRIVEKARKLVKEEKVDKEANPNGKDEESASKKRKTNLERQESTEVSNDASATDVTKVIKDELRGKETEQNNKKTKNKETAENDEAEKEPAASPKPGEAVEDPAVGESSAPLPSEDALQVREESEDTGVTENEGEPVSVDELQLTVDPKDSLMLEATVEKENISSAVFEKADQNHKELSTTPVDDSNKSSSSHRRSSTGRSDRERKNHSDTGNDGPAAKKPRIDTTALKHDLLAITRSNQEKMDARSRKVIQSSETNESSVQQKKKDGSTEKASEKKEGDFGKTAKEPNTYKRSLAENIKIVVENPAAERKSTSVASDRNSSKDLEGHQVTEQNKSKRRNEKSKDSIKHQASDEILKKDVKASKRSHEEGRTHDRHEKTNKDKSSQRKHVSLPDDTSSKKKNVERDQPHSKRKETGDPGRHPKVAQKVADLKAEKSHRDKVEEHSETDSDSSSDDDSSDSDSSSDTSSDSDSSDESDVERRGSSKASSKKDSSSRTYASGYRHQKHKVVEKSKSTSSNKKSRR